MMSGLLVHAGASHHLGLAQRHAAERYQEEEEMLPKLMGS